MPFALGGDVLPVAYISNWLLGTPTLSWMSETYESDTYDTTVYVCTCGAFLVADQLKEIHTFYLYVPQIRVMAVGVRLLCEEQLV